MKMKRFACLLLTLGMLAACSLGIFAFAAGPNDEAVESYALWPHYGYIAVSSTFLRLNHTYSSHIIGEVLYNHEFSTHNVPVTQDACQWIDAYMESGNLSGEFGWLIKDHTVVLY